MCIRGPWLERFDGTMLLMDTEDSAVLGGILLFGHDNMTFLHFKRSCGSSSQILTELAPKPLHSRLRQLSQTSAPLFSLLIVRITVNMKSVEEI